MLAVGLGALLLFQSSAQQQGGPPPATDAVAADTGAMRHANHRTPPLAYAARVTANNGALRVDGRLDDAAWTQARPITQFSQTQPLQGEAATERTEVRILYDDNAVYVGAKLFDSDRSGIRAQLARRDAFTEADLFEVAFDSYHDHNT